MQDKDLAPYDCAMPWVDDQSVSERYLVDTKFWSVRTRPRIFWLHPRPKWPAGVELVPNKQAGTLRVVPDQSVARRRPLPEVLQPLWWPIALRWTRNEEEFNLHCLTKWRYFARPPKGPRGSEYADAWAWQERERQHFAQSPYQFRRENCVEPVRADAPVRRSRLVALE